MKLLLLYVVFLLAPGKLLCQAINNPSAGKNIYAVVIGISGYASKGIPKLKYANRDAQVFADYLQSKPGGAVPAENIRLLKDSNATTAAVYEAISWLRETCQKNDLVYFYFAGHGDMESETIYKIGFLLTYNTPRTNYINNAIRIEDLNNFANTLSVENKANVVLITDACHSGQLAGSGYRGNYLVGDQLRTVQSKEIRITSCAPDELSMEDEAWGGGRGVFSYYFINGLNGMAEKQKDGIVTLGEMNDYLDTAFANDPLLKLLKHKQKPLLKFKNPKFQMAVVDTAKLTEARKELVVALPAQVVPVDPEQMESSELIENLFAQLTKENLEDFIDFDSLNKLPAKKIAVGFINQLQQNIPELSVPLINTLQKKLAAEPVFGEQFNSRLVVLIHDRSQEVINLYLSGDAAELERRRYYNAYSSGYDQYPGMINVAILLTKPDNYLYRILQINYFYFSSLAAYIKIPLTASPEPLVQQAFTMIQKALALEKNAAYIYNMLGAIYLYKNNLPVAETNFLKATQISPQWALPWSNLMALYTQTKDYKKATDAFTAAKNLQPDLQNIYVNAGILSELQNNLLLAEELHRKSIRLNSRHYLPFERLGFVYMNTTSYAAADSFFYEADLRKKGYHFVKPIFMRVLPAMVDDFVPRKECFFDTATLDKNDVMGFFAWGLMAYERGDGIVAEEKFKRSIAIDKNNPLAFHYLGKLLYEQKRWKEADIIFNYAVEYYRDAIAFEKYCDSVKSKAAFSPYRDCIVKKFKAAIYERVFDHYFLATLYETWNHFTEAEKQYKTLIGLTPDFIGPYHKLWTMLENIGRYQDAENIINLYGNQSRALANNELNDFYKRTTARLPNEGYWFFKAGLFLYNLVNGTTAIYKKDLKTILPDQTEPSVITNAVNHISVSHATYTQLPGINETIIDAKHIETPYSDAINYLLRADTIFAADENVLADVNDKLGDLFVWQGVPEKANGHYQKASDMQPQNTGIRLKLIDTYSATFLFQDALVHLDTLNNRKEINFPKQLMLAKYRIHAARIKEAENLLMDARAVHPYRVAEIADLSGRLHLLENQPKQAMVYYKEYLESHPNNPFTLYSIARLYSQLKKNGDAWEWLQKSMDKGFLYSYVLQYDSFWNEYRNTGKWKKLMAGYTFKTYSLPPKDVN